MKPVVQLELPPAVAFETASGASRSGFTAAPSRPRELYGCSAPVQLQTAPTDSTDADALGSIRLPRDSAYSSPAAPGTKRSMQR